MHRHYNSLWQTALIKVVIVFIQEFIDGAYCDLFHHKIKRCAMLTNDDRFSIKNNWKKYTGYSSLFISMILVIHVIKPKQEPDLENGKFVNKSSGNIITINNGMIYYAGHKSPYSIWAGKGKRMLYPKTILGNLYQIEMAGGNKVPSAFVLENKNNTASVCSVENNHDEICFYRKNS